MVSSRGGIRTHNLTDLESSALLATASWQTYQLLCCIEHSEIRKILFIFSGFKSILIYFCWILIHFQLIWIHFKWNVLKPESRSFSLRMFQAAMRQKRIDCWPQSTFLLPKWWNESWKRQSNKSPTFLSLKTFESYLYLRVNI